MTKVITLTASLFITGLGFTLASRYLLALCLTSLFFAINAAAFWSRIILTPAGFISWAIVIVILNSLTVVFALKTSYARVTKIQYCLATLHSVFFLFLVTAIILQYEKTLGIAVHYVPSDSMSPTIAPRNYVISDTWIYKRQHAKVGDVVLFRRKATSPIYLKRVHSARSGKYTLQGDNAYATIPSLYFGTIKHDLLISKAKLKINTEKFSVSKIR